MGEVALMNHRPEIHVHYNDAPQQQSCALLVVEGIIAVIGLLFGLILWW